MKYSRRVWRINNMKNLIMNSDSKHNSQTLLGHSSCPLAWIWMSYGCINPYIIRSLLEMSPRENETVIQSKLERVSFISDNQSCVCVCVWRRACVSVSRRWWRFIVQTGVRRERIGPFTYFPPRTSMYYCKTLVLFKSVQSVWLTECLWVIVLHYCTEGLFWGICILNTEYLYFYSVTYYK